MGSHTAEFNELGIRILGYSMAGEETCFILPEMNLAFDIGRAPRDVLAVDHVFLSHGHTDHAAGIAYYFSQRWFIDNAPGFLYLPRELEAPVRRLLRVWGEIDGHEPPANIVVAEPGRDIEIRRDLAIRPFPVNHPCRRPDGTVIHTLGFTAIEVRQKLKDEFSGLSAPELVALKEKGVEITRRAEIPLVCYCGDTAAGDFVELDHVRNARVLLLECTFFEADHVRRARQGNHMHVADLPALLSRLNNQRILLIHTSRRTALSEARSILKRELGGQMDARVAFFMEFRRRGRSGAARPAEAPPRPSHEPAAGREG